MAVRVYFVICLVSRQCVINHDAMKGQVDMGFPLMTALELLFFVGWMKVAEALLNPLGEDDDDIECNWLIDKNIAHHNTTPRLRLDIFADPAFKPVYSEDSAWDAPINQGGSAANVELAPSHEKVKMVAVDTVSDEARKTSETAATLRRKLTTAFSFRSRSNSIQPIPLDRSKKISDVSVDSNGSKNLNGLSMTSDHPFHLAPLDEESDSIKCEEGRNSIKDDKNVG
ncbi:unnamed protein product [Caenorhabditis bovis]|uniref:Bestrophin homolog n=1 Tax=Caenorhabditis bovis TaxID=2654633 RepID=A0A8S1EHJ7_9PELO|nr:unnamed protein product [Caenorhabditis bovis]